jgi:hypothetical protein
MMDRLEAIAPTLVDPSELVRDKPNFQVRMLHSRLH